MEKMKINHNYTQLEKLQPYEKKEENNPNFYRIYSELRFLSNLSNSLSGNMCNRESQVLLSLQGSAWRKDCV